MSSTPAEPLTSRDLASSRPRITLVPLAGSTQNLPGGTTAGPAQVSFSPDGGVLVVTEKGTNLIDTFTVNESGVAQPGVSVPSNGGTPFGFVFGHDECRYCLRCCRLSAYFLYGARRRK